MAEVTGFIVASTGTGVKVGDVWFNYGREYALPQPPPVRGQRVKVQYNPRDGGGGWITALEVLDGGAVQQSFRGAGGGYRGKSDEERKDIRRMSALRAAAAFCSGKSTVQEVGSAEVLKVAEAWLRWLENA
jgi:hypothetical protein